MTEHMPSTCKIELIALLTVTLTGAVQGFAIQICSVRRELTPAHTLWLWLWWYKIQVLSVIGPCSGSQNWNWLASVVWGCCQSDHYCDKNWNWPRWSGMVPNRSLMSQFKLGILGRTLKEMLPSACPVFSWRSLPMVLLPHCPGGCSRGSPLCLQSSCPARWDGALVSEVSGSYLWWISSRSGQCGSPGVTLCRIRVGTCRLRLRLSSFSCVLDMEASADVDVQGMGGPLDGPTFWLPSSGLFPPQRRDLSDSSRLGSTHNDHTPGVAWHVLWTAGQKLLALGSRRTCGWLQCHGLPLKLPVPRVAWKREPCRWSPQDHSSKVYFLWKGIAKN